MTATNIGVQMKSNSAISELEWKKARNPSNSSNPAVGFERPGSNMSCCGVAAKMICSSRS